MDLTLTSVVWLKLLLVPALIYIVTLIGRRWGAGVAGWFSALPIVSGPILLVLAIEEGAGFASSAAGHTILAVVAIVVFSLAYAWSSIRLGIAGSMAVALLSWAASVAGLQRFEFDPIMSFLLVVALLAITPRLFPAISSAHPAPARRTGDLFMRLLAGAALSLAVTWGAARLGARLSGFFAMFPVMSSILVGFSHRASGRDFAVNLLRGMVRGYYAFAAFCLVLSLALRNRALVPAFMLAVCAALAVQLLSRRGMVAARVKPVAKAGAGAEIEG